MALPEIDILGTGNLAYNLAPALEQAGFVVNNVFGRSIAAAEKLAGRLYQAKATVSFDFSHSSSSVFLLAISDDAVEEVSRELVLPENAIIAHTSGSNPLAVLGYTACPNIGVFYPLQTFSKHRKVSFKDIPILIEGENSYTHDTLTKIAKKLSNNVQTASTKQRLMIHLAAVFASNFTTTMLTHADDLLKAIKVDINILAPLVIESIEKSFEIGPCNAQTGPAVRGDLEILDKHLAMLKGLPEKQEIYRLISQQILDRYAEEK